MGNVQQLANSLRKQGNLKEALSIYQDLWGNNTRDKYVAAGYLHCLRKLNMYKEAQSFVSEYSEDFIEYDWFRNEVIWTYIGKLKTMSETSSLGSVLPIVNKIMNLNPDDLPKNTTILFVLKKAKQFKKWDIASKWVEIIDPNTLEKKPISLAKGSTGWSNYLIWHHHKIRCLIHQRKYQEAIDLVRFIIKEANQEKKFFLCLEAQAYEQMGNLDEAIKILMDLTRHKKVDWWIVHQLANVYKSKGDRESALKKMYQAATLSFKIESIVTLLYDIAMISRDLDKSEESFFHLLLFKKIREKKEWGINDNVQKLIHDTGNSLNLNSEISYKDVLFKCRQYWEATIEMDNKKATKGSFSKQQKKGLSGILIQVKDERPFCFIKSFEESYFCYKSDINGEAKEGLKVVFDVIASFDKKKQQESWKAINIVLI